MKFLIVFTLSVLAFGTFSNAQYNRQPCVDADDESAYDDFLEKHILPEDFDPSVRNAWKSVIRSRGQCHRNFHSFILNKDLKTVEQICNGIGKTLAGKPSNLCIGNSKIPVYRVEINTANCMPTKDVKPVEEQVIVACDNVDDVCRPVHLQKNEGQEPDSKSKTCKPSGH